MPLYVRDLASPVGTAVGECAVSKRFNPGQAGARKLGHRFGEALVCVRHRVHAPSATRYTTVELVVATSPITPQQDVDVLLRVRYEETELRERIKRHGARWDRARKQWLMSRRVALGLGLGARVVGLADAARRVKARSPCDEKRGASGNPRVDTYG